MVKDFVREMNLANPWSLTIDSDTISNWISKPKVLSLDQKGNTVDWAHYSFEISLMNQSILPINQFYTLDYNINTIADLFSKHKQYFSEYKIDDMLVISDKTIENAEMITTNLSKYIDTTENVGVEFEPDDDGSILIFINRNNCEIIINVFEEIIEYSVRKTNVKNSFEAYQINLNSISKLYNHLKEWLSIDIIWNLQTVMISVPNRSFHRLVKSSEGSIAIT